MKNKEGEGLTFNVEPFTPPKPLILLEASNDPNTIKFFIDEDENNPILELNGGGDILVKGKVIKKDEEVYLALKEFLLPTPITDKQAILNLLKDIGEENRLCCSTTMEPEYIKDKISEIKKLIING